MLNQYKTLLLLIVVTLNGCSLFPYEDKFGCNKPDNLGKCISPAEAYEEITTGRSKDPYMKPYSEQTEEEREANKRQKSTDNGIQQSNHIDELPRGYDQYVDASYSEIANLLDKPVTPIIKPVKTAELLVFPYSEKENILKGERYINVILEKPGFILGDYLKKQPIQMQSLFNE